MVTNNKHEAVDGWFYLTPGGGLPVRTDMQTFLHSDVCDLRAKRMLQDLPASKAPGRASYGQMNICGRPNKWKQAACLLSAVVSLSSP